MSMDGGSVPGQRPMRMRPNGPSATASGSAPYRRVESFPELRPSSGSNSPAFPAQLPLPPLRSPPQAPSLTVKLPPSQRRGAGPGMRLLAAPAACGAQFSSLPSAIPVPQAPQMVINELPGPTTIKRQKDDHAIALETQLRSGADELGSTHQQKTDHLHAVASQQKHQFNLMLDQRVKEQEMMLVQEFNQQLMQLQQAAQTKRAVLETQASTSAMKWQQNKVQQEFQRQKESMEDEYTRAQGKIAEKIEKLGITPLMRMRSASLPGSRRGPDAGQLSGGDPILRSLPGSLTAQAPGALTPGRPPPSVAFNGPACVQYSAPVIPAPAENLPGRLAYLPPAGSLRERLAKPVGLAASAPGSYVAQAPGALTPGRPPPSVAFNGPACVQYSAPVMPLPVEDLPVRLAYAPPPGSLRETLATPVGVAASAPGSYVAQAPGVLTPGRPPPSVAFNGPACVQYSAPAIPALAENLSVRLAYAPPPGSLREALAAPLVLAASDPGSYVAQAPGVLTPGRPPPSVAFNGPACVQVSSNARPPGTPTMTPRLLYVSRCPSPRRESSVGPPRRLLRRSVSVSSGTRDLTPQRSVSSSYTVTAPPLGSGLDRGRRRSGSSLATYAVVDRMVSTPVGDASASIAYRQVMSTQRQQSGVQPPGEMNRQASVETFACPPVVMRPEAALTISPTSDVVDSSYMEVKTLDLRIAVEANEVDPEAPETQEFTLQTSKASWTTAATACTPASTEPSTARSEAAYYVPPAAAVDQAPQSRGVLQYVPPE